MNLHEYQAKRLFSRYGLPIPLGFVCTTPGEAEEFSLKIGTGPWVLKCQVHAGGRGKSGGVKVVRSKGEIFAFVEKWLGQRLVTPQTDSLGKPVHQILIEAVSNIARELYLGALVDPGSCRIIFIASIQGGMEIEKVAKETPYLIHKVVLDPLTGPQPYQGRELAFKLGLNSKQVYQFVDIFIGLARLFLELDLAMVEINPLVITESGDFICLDGKMIADGNALFRQPGLRVMHDYSQEDAHEAHATQWGMNYVSLSGNIGCMVNGAGLAMGTMDMIKLYGGEPANFLDIGGGVTKECVIEAFKILLLDKKVKAVLVNIFGGIVRCDLIAESIIGAMSEMVVNIPVIVRLEGNNAQLGRKWLLDSGLNIISVSNLAQAAQQIISVVREK